MITVLAGSAEGFESEEIADFRCRIEPAQPLYAAGVMAVCLFSLRAFRRWLVSTPLAVPWQALVASRSGFHIALAVFAVIMSSSRFTTCACGQGTSDKLLTARARTCTADVCSDLVANGAPSRCSVCCLAG